MSTLELFDKDAALGHVKSLEFQRLANTKGEIKALNYIKKQLDGNKIEYKEEEFTWTKSTSFLMKLAFIFVFCYVLIYQFLLLLTDWIFVIIILDFILLVIIYFGIKILFDMTKIIYIGKRSKSKNLISHLNARESYQKKPVIIFSAHYDSISVRFPYIMQLFLYIIGGLLLLTYLLLTLIMSIWSILNLLNFITINDLFLNLRIAAFILGLVLMIDIFIIILNKRTNESYGSVDNATGVAILIEVAKLIKKIPLENMDAMFLWCGAEEWGLWGSKQYCASHFNELKEKYDLDNSYNINIDMVGSYIGLVDKTGLIKKKRLNRTLNDVLGAIAKNQNIPLKRSFIPIGAGSDHMSFRAFARKCEKNLEVSCFLSNKDGKYIHSSKDKSELCSSSVLNGCIELCFQTLTSLDKRVERVN